MKFKVGHQTNATTMLSEYVLTFKNRLKTAEEQGNLKSKSLYPNVDMNLVRTKTETIIKHKAIENKQFSDIHETVTPTLKNTTI